MSRIAKLIRQVAQSDIRDKKVMLAALSKCMADPAKKARENDIEPFLAFGRKGSGETETEFRLYAKCAIALNGYVKNVPDMTNVKLLQKSFTGDFYGNLDSAFMEYRSALSAAYAVQKKSLAAIPDLHEFAAASNLSPDNCRQRIENSLQGAVVAMQVTIARLEKPDAETREMVTRWFGKNSSETLINNYKLMLARLCATGGGLSIEKDQDWAGAKWGSTVSGTESISLGRLFFDDNSTFQTDRFTKDYKADPALLQTMKADMKAVNDANEAKEQLNLLITVLNGMPDASTVRAALDQAFVTRKELKDNYLPETRTGLMRILESANVPLDQSPASVFANRGAIGKSILDKAQKNNADMTENIAQKVTDFGVIIHELSHNVLGTQDLACKDVKIDLPGVVYGAFLCQIAALNSPEKVLNNADNYAYLSQSLN